MRGVFERDGTWWISYFVNGKHHREKVGKKSDAVKLYQTRKADILRGKKLPELNRRTVTMGELFGDAVKYADKRLRSADDYHTKGRILGAMCQAVDANSIEPLDIREILLRLPVSDATRNRYKSFLSLAFRLGIESGKVSTNPCKAIQMYPENNARTRYLTPEEYGRLLAVVRRDYPEHAPALIVAVFSGMRWSEQFGMTWEQVDWEHKVIRRVRTKTVHVEDRYRSVPLNSVSLAALREQEAIHPQGCGCGKQAGVKVFPSGYYVNWFVPARQDAGLSDICWHSLRHTALSWAAMSGASMVELQAIGGHKTITMAARYAHLSPDSVGVASERMAEWTYQLRQVPKTTATRTATCDASDAL